ncbi:hypothetical protein Patl1_32393 [Pistacia atlantica]|uniref:Uncharacterized protein n=1 Tax=Pistacia atlantica TaxID=434234 RepID=A0ACC1AMC9_9ROSI|nr:hypothetical protein Patl1_32393 [Pistacia atlantica]
MVSVLCRCSKAKGKFATSPSHASNSGTTVSLNSVEDVPLIVSSQDEQFQPSPPIAPSITLSHSEDVTLPSSYYRFGLSLNFLKYFTSTKVKSGRTRGKGLSKMNKSFGKKLKVHVDLIKWKDMEVHDFNLALDNLDAKCEKNVENRTKNTMPHNQGSMALVVVRNEIVGYIKGPGYGPKPKKKAGPSLQIKRLADALKESEDRFRESEKRNLKYQESVDELTLRLE